jgi:hypothetical protein
MLEIIQTVVGPSEIAEPSGADTIVYPGENVLEASRHAQLAASASALATGARDAAMGAEAGAEIARDAALAAANYRSTLAAAVAAFAVGAIFTSDESGALAWYRRTNVAPFYTLIDYVRSGSVLPIGVFAAANGTAISPFTEIVQTSGYYAAGDDGAALFVHVAAEPAHPAKFQAADGRWFGLSPMQMHRAEMFGAKGDGIIADHAAINAGLAADVVRDLHLGPKNYLIDGPLFPQDDGGLIGLGSDVTRITRKPYAIPLTGTTSSIASDIGPKLNVRLKGFTLNNNMAGQGGGDLSRCHFIATTAPAMRRSRASVAGAWLTVCIR